MRLNCLKDKIINHLRVVLFFVIIPVYSFGQSNPHKSYPNEISISSINDNFLPPLQDEYYTNGLNIAYGYVLKGRFPFNNLGDSIPVKSILRFKIQQNIYTPSSIDEKKAIKLDRPYASSLYLQSSLQSLWKANNSLSIGLMLGVIGPNAGGEKIQTWWHRIFDFTTPEGWQYQIDNTAIVNLSAAYRHSWMLSHHVDVISTSSAAAGTAFDNISSGLMMRLGKINPISNSALTQSRVSRNRGTELNYTNEWFFVFGFNNTVDFHNTTIEGGIFHPDRSPHAKQAKPYYFTIKGGFGYSNPSFTWKLMMDQLTTKVSGAKPHNYVSIKLAFRF